jgi:hypothetical protein
VGGPRLSPIEFIEPPHREPLAVTRFKNSRNRVTPACTPLFLRQA